MACQEEQAKSFNPKNYFCFGGWCISRKKKGWKTWHFTEEKQKQSNLNSNRILTVPIATGQAASEHSNPTDSFLLTLFPFSNTKNNGIWKPPVAAKNTCLRKKWASRLKRVLKHSSLRKNYAERILSEIWADKFFNVSVFYDENTYLSMKRRWINFNVLFVCRKRYNCS